MTDKNDQKEEAARQKKIWLRLTSVCNNRCIFCLDKNNQDGSMVPLKEIYRLLEKGKKDGTAKVILSGGEPTLHPDILKIIKKAKKLGFQRIQMITNGRMFAYEEFVSNLKKAGLDEVTFSMHAHEKKLFEKITGMEGSYLQSIRGLNNAIKSGFIISIDIVISRLNYKKLREIMDFYVKFGVTEFDLLHLIPFGEAWNNWDKINYSPKDAKKYLNNALELSKSENIFVWTNRLPAEHLEGYEDLIQNPVKLKTEVSGMQEMFYGYMNNGITMPCRGKRCGFCIMKEFCDDLIYLREHKKISGKKYPKCLNEKGRPVEKFFLSKKKFDIFSFTDFFIENRYFVKSLRCEECKLRKKCSGAWIEDIRKRGFKILKPFLRK